MRPNAGRAALATLAALQLSTVSAFAQEIRDFGAARFVPPPGWSVDSGPTVLTLGWARGRDRCLIVMAAPQPSPPGLDAAFSAAWSAIFSNNNYRRAQQPASAERTSPAGDRHAVGEGEVEDAAGNRLLARLHVFPIGPNSQWIVLISNGPQAVAACRSDWDAFFASLRFGSVAAEPAPPAAAPPASVGERAGPPPSAAAPGPHQFENITFVAPRGWSMRRVNGLVQLSPLGARSVEKLDVLLLPGRVSPASLERELEATWSEVRSLLGAQPMMTVNHRPYDPHEPARTLGGVEYLRGDGSMRRADGEWDVSAYVFRAGDRVERAAVVARVIRENLHVTHAALNPAYARAIRELLFTMKFATQPARPLARAGLRPGGIVGVWAGLGVAFGRMSTEFAIFFDNGMAYFGSKFPMRGLLEIDPVIEQPARKRDWGTYTWSGGAGVLTMPHGAIPLRSTGAALVLTTNRTDHRYVRLVMPQSLRLDGTWCQGDGLCLRLTADGRFQDTGAARAVEHELYPWPTTPVGGEGRYTLHDHTLVLTYDGGQEIRLAFPGVEDARSSSPNVLRLGLEGDLLTRR